jgi:hypothetical protein
MNNSSSKKILPFPKPSGESGTSMIAVQIGDERFAIRWYIVDLPPKELLVLPKRAPKKAPAKSVK